MAIRPIRYELDLSLDFDRRRLEGEVVLEVRNDGPDAVADVPLLLNRRLRVERAAPGLRVDQAVVPVAGLPAMEINQVLVGLPEPLPPGGTTRLGFRYAGGIGDYVATGMRYIRDRIDPSFTIVRMDAHAYPVLGVPDLAVLRAADRPAFDWRARIDVQVGLVAACGGRPTGTTGTTGTTGRAVHTFESLRPSWRMDFAIAPFETLSRGDLRVHHLPGDGAGAARVLRGVEDAFRLFSEWFGPLLDPSPFTVIEIPDGWGSQADVTCILQTAAAFRDPQRLVEVYHEVSHLWNPPDLDRPSPRLNEGLATFLQYEIADRLDRTSRREDAVARTIARLRERRGEDEMLREVPFADYGRAGRTDLSYTVGLLLFDALERRVGTEAFRALVGGFYRTCAARGARTEDFVRLAVETAGADLEAFFREWLFTTAWTGRLC
ncbi:MAG: hypothetical protein ACC662_04745 [Planctomycetota bacterium]